MSEREDSSDVIFITTKILFGELILGTESVRRHTGQVRNNCQAVICPLEALTLHYPES